MRRVVRYLSVVVAITLMPPAESVSIATAAVPPLQPIPGAASVAGYCAAVGWRTWVRRHSPRL